MFRALGVVYTVKELDSLAKHGQSLKKLFGGINLTSGFVQVSESFFIMALADVNDGGFPYMGISPGRTRPCTHSERASFDCTAQDSLGKNVSEEVCFWLWGKDNRLQLPEEPSVTKQWMRFFFLGQKLSFSSVCWRMFYKQGPVRCWICTSFNTERWSSPCYKRSRSWFRTADGKLSETASNVCFASDRAQVFVTL